MVDCVETITVLRGLHLGIQLHKNLRMEFRSRPSLLSFENPRWSANDYTFHMTSMSDKSNSTGMIW